MQVSAEGMLASGGFHSHGADQVERYRAAVDADRTGGQLASIVAALRRDGLAIGGDRGHGWAAVLGCPDGADLLALRQVPAGFFGVFMSVDPVFAALTGLVLLGQSLGLASWLAVAAIVTANVVSPATAGRRAAPATA